MYLTVLSMAAPLMQALVHSRLSGVVLLPATNSVGPPGPCCLCGAAVLVVGRLAAVSSPLMFSCSVIPGTYMWQGNEEHLALLAWLLPSTSEPWKGPWKGPLQMGRRKDSASFSPLGTLSGAGCHSRLIPCPAGHRDASPDPTVSWAVPSLPCSRGQGCCS